MIIDVAENSSKVTAGALMNTDVKCTPTKILADIQTNLTQESVSGVSSADYHCSLSLIIQSDFFKISTLQIGLAMTATSVRTVSPEMLAYDPHFVGQDTTV